MDSKQKQMEVTDGVVLSAGFATSNGSIIIYTANKQDAEWIYNTINNIANERSLTETAEMGLGRKYYLQLSESDGPSMYGKGKDGWNNKPVYKVKFQPTEVSQQRMMHWNDDGQSISAPTDFEITPLIAELVYRSGAHEMNGEGGPYIEFEAVGSQRLQAELQNLDIRTTKINDLWHMDVENSEKFREYAGIPEPNGGD